MTLSRRRGALAVAALVVVAAAVGIAMTAGGGAPPDVTTVPVTKGDFVDYIQIRGDIRPVKSVVISAPVQSGGDLLITKLVKNGSAVKKGDILVEFDKVTLEQRLQERQSDLKSAEADIQQSVEQRTVNDQQDAQALVTARYDVDRARLDLGKKDIVSPVEYEEAKLALADAEQKLKEVEAKNASNRAGSDAEILGKKRKRDKAKYDVDRTAEALAVLTLRAPEDGTVNILDNPRSGGPFSNGVEFREGDRIWAGAQVLELPDLSAIHLEARLDESDRGRLKVGQTATVKIEAVPGKEFTARVDLISVLARVDFSSGWPPVRNFDLGLVLKDHDARIRPGMTATARIAADSLPNMTLVPAETIFQHNGRPVVYRLRGSKFDEQPIEIVRRGREQAAVSAGVTPGDKLATHRPDAALIRARS
jgi:multidrug efflux pump subunit AcrA (membrane-fusion protein)